MVVELVLPQLISGAVEKFVCRKLFERIHEGEHVAGVGCACAKEVKVVGHGAIGVNGKGFARGGGLEMFDYGFGIFVFCEERFALVAADGHEIVPFSQIV